MDEERMEGETQGKIEDQVDALFELPLTAFTGARNDLAARLKRGGRADDANLVKALAKPSVSAWAVNQLYWKHRDEFDRLLAAGQHFRQAQTSHSSGRVVDMRESLDARREALSRLSDLAAVVLRDAGHNPTADTLHRITTTLEAVSAFATPSDGPTPGRLSQDVDPPGFGSLASLIPGTDTKQPNEELARVTPSQKPEQKPQQIASSEGDVQKVRQLEEAHRARIAAAKASLQEARTSLTKARSRAQSLEAAQEKAHAEMKAADAEAKSAETQLCKAEERFKKASADSQDAANRAQRIASEAEEASQAVEEAGRTVEAASTELESLLQDISGSRG